MADNQDQQRHVKTVSPTIFIGLGGTGREALLRIRQEMCLQFGVPALPVHRFVWIDCDPSIGQEVDNKPFDWLLPAAQFTESDIVTATVDAGTFGSYASNPASHKWLYKWVDPGIFSVGSITAGASQVRPRGRCAFYANYEKIRRKLSDSWNAITSNPAEQRLHDEFDGMKSSGTPRVFIFNSLAGGTGSGMVLDVAFLCRSMGMDMQKEADIYGYQFLPSIFAPVNEKSAKLYANAYAALTELEFYGLPRDIGEATQNTAEEKFRGIQRNDAGTIDMKDVRRTLAELLPPGGSRHDFKEYWNQDANNPGFHRGPAFDYCYLVGNTSDSGVDLPSGESKGDLLDCIAQAVFIESSGHPLSGKITSSRDNIRPWLGSLTTKSYEGALSNEIIFQDVWSNLYSSVGFSFIQAPNFNVRFSCAYRLGLEILDDFIMDDPSPEPDLQRRVEAVISEGKLHVTGPQYVAALDVHAGGASYIQSTVDPWATALNSRIVGGQEEGAWALMIQRELQSIQKRALSPKAGQRDDWGELFKVLDTNAYRGDEGGERRCKRDSLDAELRALTAGWLDEPGGIARAVERLRELHRYLADNILPRLEANRDGERQQAETSLKAVNGNLGALQHEEAGKHRKSAQKLALEGVRHAREFLAHRIMYEVLEYAVALHRELLNTIMVSELVDDGGKQVTLETSGLVVQLNAFRDRLYGVQSHFQSELEKYDAQPKHHIFIELYRKGMYEQHWNAARIDIPTERQGFYDLIGATRERGFGFMRMTSSEGNEWAQRVLEEYCRAKFATATVSIDAVAELSRTEDRDQKVRSMVRRAAPWVRASAVARLQQQIQHNSRAEYHFAYNMSGSGEAYTWFQRAAASELGQEPFAAYQPKDISSSDAADLILLYCEKGALPLAYIDNLPKYRDAYRQMLGIGVGGSGQVTYFPHSDVTVATYPDICPSSDDEITKKRRATEAFLLGLILGVVELQKDGSGELQQYSMKLTLGFRDIVVPLGNSRGQVVHTLLSSGDKLEGLEERVAQAKNTLNREQVVRYAALLRWMIDGAFAQRWVTSPMGNTETFNLEHSVFAAEFAAKGEQIMREYGDAQVGRAVIDEAEADIKSGSCSWVEPLEIDGVRAFKLR